MKPSVPPAVPRPVAGSVLRRVARVRATGLRQLEDCIAEEVPVAFICNGAPYAVMMASPTDLADFAVGFALAEELAQQATDVRIERIAQLIEGVEIHLQVPAGSAGLRRARGGEAPSGCGLCGSRLLEDVARSPRPVEGEVRVGVDALRAALRGLRAGQSLNAATGATHAAGWAGVDGQVRLVREDVGRHNALDKLVGAMRQQAIDPRDGFLVVTSRASYEMAMKAATAGITLMAAASAPTALAVSLADRANLTLVGFAREDGHAVYTHSRRLVGPAPAAADGAVR